MKPHFHYSSDIYGINAKEIADCCVHLICLEGGGSFVFNGKGFSLTKNCILVVPNPAKIENIKANENSVFEWFAAPSAKCVIMPSGSMCRQNTSQPPSAE